MTWAPTSFTELVLLAVIAGCGSARPIATAVPTGDTHEADAELARGCYDCLIAARDGYAKAHHGRGELEADVLLAIRAKELGLRGDRSIDDARSHELGVPDAGRILALVDAIPDDSISARARRHLGATAKAIEADRRWLYTSSLDPVVRDYIALALDCAFEPLANVPAVRTTVPILAYRKEICGFGRISALGELRRHEPRFVETGYAMAMTELAMLSVAGPQHAKEHIDEVRAKFPTSTQASLALGTYLRALGDHHAALAVYDELSAKAPDLVDAQLGRAYCLGALGKATQAIEVATSLIEAGEYVELMLPERAARYRELGRLDLARASIDTAKSLSPQPRTLQLAGIIEYEQADLAIATEDLKLARDADDDDCTSRWYLGLIEAKRGDASEATKAFSDAGACYRQRSAKSLAKAAELKEPSDLDAAYRDGQIATLEASSAADLAQAAAGDAILVRLARRRP